MTAVVIPLMRRTPVAPIAADKAQNAELTAIQTNLEFQREQLLELIEGLRSSPAAAMKGDLGDATESLSSAACFTLVQVELMLRQARALASSVRA